MDDWSKREVAFFGKITAGFTHEMKNVLAIVKESSGLIEDIISIEPEVLVPHQEKFNNSLARIKNQIQRGVELTNRLNQFAHSPDEIIAEFDLYEIIELVTALAHRFARLKNVDLHTEPPERSEQSLCLETRPVRMQMALFAAIECCLEAIQDGGVIRVGHGESKGKYTVNLWCNGDLSEKSEFIDKMAASTKWVAVQSIAESLMGSAELDESAPGITLRLPQKMSR